MKKYLGYIGLGVVVIVFGIWVFRESQTRADGVGLAYITLNGEKRQVPDFKLINQNGDTITEAYYDDKVYVVEFFFSTCPTICPIMNKNMVQIQRKFYGEDQFGIASISIDPVNDTVQQLNAYAKEIGVKHKHWNMMTGDMDDIMQLANQGFNLYAKQESRAAGGFEHSGFFALVDKEGYLRSRRDSNGNPIVFYQGAVEYDSDQNRYSEEQQIDILIEDIKQLLKE
jgi:protein SCO1/2